MFADLCLQADLATGLLNYPLADQKAFLDELTDSGWICMD